MPVFQGRSSYFDIKSRTAFTWREKIKLYNGHYPHIEAYFTQPVQ